MSSALEQRQCEKYILDEDGFIQGELEGADGGLLIVFPYYHPFSSSYPWQAREKTRN